MILIIILEFLLFSIDYGNDYTTFVKISDQFPEYKFFNPSLPAKYFGSSSITPAVISDGFKEEKSENTFRIFALGGSTTAGFPHPPNGSFPRILKNLLHEKYPSIDFEVINLGVSAINSVTIRDIIDDVILEKPDLVILYAGHNEYYGALGPASNVSGFNNSAVTRLILKIKEYRTVQLVENLIRWSVGVFSEKKVNNTLMNEMAGNNLVTIDSDVYNSGVTQFERNLEYILSVCSEKEIPTMVGTLASNLMQTPLCKFSGCENLCSKFETIVKNLDSTSHGELIEIKEEDQLRFRAPEKFNEIIKSFAEKYNSILFDVKSSFENNSPNGIIGDNLMMDHLHPTFDGNKLIAEIIFYKFPILGVDEQLNEKKRKILPFMIYENNYRFYSEMDSAFASMRINHLKSSFPFSKNKNDRPQKSTLINISDSIANEIISGKIGWENAHLKLAKNFFSRGDYQKFMDEINILIEDKPFDKFPYLEALKLLESIKRPDLNKYILKKYFLIYPELFAARKLADIEFAQTNFHEAIYYYERCILVDKKDPKLYYNLSSSYFALKNINSALLNMKKCLELDANFPNAAKIYNGLVKIYQSRKN